jgi:AbrB family looped-hinge helix DNA binding protein
MKTTVSSKGQIVLPAEIRKQDRIRPGQEFEVERIEEGLYQLSLTTRRRNQGLVQLLLGCPVKGWFEPLSRTETTDDVRGPHLG